MFKNKLLVIGTNHKSGSLKFREDLVFSKEKRQEVLCFLKAEKFAEGSIILSTCNRVEIYISTTDLKESIHKILSFLAEYHEMDRRLLVSQLYILSDKEAIQHLFNVSAGLDSLILGELQILGQVRKAFDESMKIQFIDDFLNRVFREAMCMAQVVHKKTKISKGKVSVGSIAIDFLRQRSGPICKKNILILGVGKVTELVLKYLSDERPYVIFISNRTFDKARKLAQKVNGKAIRFDELKNVINIADAIITATASPHFLITKQICANVTRPLQIIDLAMPRDVDPAVNDFENISLHTLEDLSAIIESNKEKKEKEAQKALIIIEHKVDVLWEKFIASGHELVRLP